MTDKGQWEGVKQAAHGKDTEYDKSPENQAQLAAQEDDAERHEQERHENDRHKNDRRDTER